MSYRLGGRNSLAYIGVEPLQPPDLLVINRPPISTDSQNFNIGTFWIVPRQPSILSEVWVLVSLVGGVATWVQLYPGAGGATVFVEDVGMANVVGGLINIIGGSSTAGINMNTSGSGNTVEIILNDSLLFPPTNNTGTQGVLFWNGNRFLHSFNDGGTDNNIFLGNSAGNFTLDSNATANIAVGSIALSSLTGGGVDLGAANTGVGNAALRDVTSGSFNTALGSAGFNLTTGAGNTFIGHNTGRFLLTGNTNLLLGGDDNFGGFATGNNYTTSESSNILLQNEGVMGESNVMRLGTDGVGDSQVDAAYIAGIYNRTIGATNSAVFIDNTGKLGTVVLNQQNVSCLGTGGSPTNSIAVAGSTSWIAPFGTQNSTTQTDSQYVCPTSGILNHLYVYVSANTSTTDVTFTLNVNSVNTSVVVTVPSLTTGVFFNLIDSASVIETDLIQVEAEASTIGSVLGTIACRFQH